MRPVTTFPNSSGNFRNHDRIGSAALIDAPQQPLTEGSAAKASDLSECYRCLLIFDDNNSGQYCLAQAEGGTRYAHQVVLIRKVRLRSIHKLQKPNPRILSLLDAFQTHDTIALVSERPGVSLSRIVLAPSLNDEYMRTICREIAEALAVLDESGLCLPSICLDDVSISSVDGTLKLAADQAVPCADGRRTASSLFLELLYQMQSAVSDESLALRKLSSWATKCADSGISQVLNAGNKLLPSNFTVWTESEAELLQGTAPASSLAAVALVADATVLPDECTLGIGKGIDHDVMDIMKLSSR